MKQSLILLTLLLTAISCSQKGTDVGLKVSHNFVMGGANTSSIAGGGLIVWGQSTTGQNFAQILEDKDELKLSLENTNWTFYAMAWDGSKNYEGAVNPSSNTPFGGVVRCGKSLPTVLSGQPTSVDLSINNANCSDAVFAGNAGMQGTNFPSTKMNFCSTLTSITGSTNICTDDYTNTNKKSHKAPIGSYRFSAITHKNGVENGSFVGKCISTTTSLEQPGLPAGGQGLPFKIVLEMFPGSTDCDSSLGRRGAEKILYPNGIYGAPVASSKVYTGQYKNHHYIEMTPTQICIGRSGTTMVDHPFAAGSGTKAHPYVICSVPQWYQINIRGEFASSYKLQADLDFNPYSVGLGNALLDQATCLELGTNFLPVGYNSAMCSGNTMIWDNLTSFSGSFFGSGFSIKNLRLRDEDKSHLGLFGMIEGTNIYIGDFVLEKPEIEGRFRVGAITAEASGTMNQKTDIVFNNIKINNAEIQARPQSGDNGEKSDVGSLVGYMYNASARQVSVLKSKVRGDSSQVGGIVGYLYNGDLTKVISEVDVEARSNQTITDVGGVVGQIESSLLNWIKHEGEVKTDGKQVGGIAGTLVNSSLTNFYTISNINSNSSDLYNYSGGVIGYWQGSGNLDNGYSLANVQTGCSTGCKQGSIIGYAGSGTPTISSTVYALGPVESGEQATNITGTFVTRSISDMRNTSMVTSLPDINADDWKIVNDVYPRFDFEYHPCSSGSNNTGLGTAASPVLICNEDQYLSYASSSMILKLMTNIRLTNSNTIAYEIPTFTATLEGNNKAVIGGNSNFAGGTATAHIGTLNGEIRNLKIFGMKRSNASSNTMSQPGSVFVGINNGKLLNLNVSVKGAFQAYASGFVGKNAGLIQNVKFDGNFSGTDTIAHFVYANLSAGKIYDSKVGGQLQCNYSSCQFFAGLAITNEGEIARTDMSVNFHDQASNATNSVSMLVDQNMATGKIIDVVVPNHVNFLTKGSGAFYFSRSNAGLYQRAINTGKLLAGDLTPTALNGFPGLGTPVLGNNTGSMIDVYRGGITGKLLLQDVPYTCTGGNILDVPAWSSLSSWTSYSSGYNTLQIADKKLVVVVKADGELPQYQQVTSISGTQLSTAMAACITSGKVSVVMTSDLLVTPGTANPVANVILPQMLNQVVFYSTGWRSIMWDMNNPDDEQKMLGYHAYKMGLSSTPVPRAVWELEDEGPRLFED